MKNVTMLRRKVARFRKEGCEVVDESLRSDGSWFAELRRNIRVLGKKVAIVRRKGWSSVRKLAEMGMKFAEFRGNFVGLRRKVCGAVEKRL